MSESSDDPALREAHSHFTSLYGVAKYLSAFWLGAWLIAISYHEKMWWYLAGAVTFLVATIVRPAFRFLWKHTDWFRVLTVFQCALTAAAVLCTREQYEKLLLWHLGASGAGVLFSFPAIRGFCRRFEIPGK
jgi:uncharacterized membrane protein